MFEWPPQRHQPLAPSDPSWLLHNALHTCSCASPLTRSRSVFALVSPLTPTDDIFRISPSGLIVAHESGWNESPSEVWDSFRPL